MKKYLVLFLLLTTFICGSYGASVSPLQPNQAFKFSSKVVSPTHVVMQWKIAPGYYLYRERFQFTVKPTVPTKITYPATNVDFDKKTRRNEGYAGVLRIPIVIEANQAQSVTISVSYQGCAKLGFCYPPMTQEITLASPPLKTDNAVAESLSTIVKDQNVVSRLLSSTHDVGWLLLIFVGLGLLLAFTPCVLPMIPILTSIIVGQRHKVSTAKAFLLSSTYVIGASTAYAAAGVLAALMGSSLQVWFQQPIFVITGAVIFILLALSLFGLFELTLPAFINKRILYMSNRYQGGAYVSVFFMGIFSALLVSPCVTAPLVGVLLYIASTGNVWLGGAALFALGVGMGLPLILIGVTAGKWLPRRGPWMEVVKKIFGVIMLVMAVWLVSRIIKLSVPLLLYGVVLITSSVFIGVHLPRHIGWTRVNRTIGGMIGVLGVSFVLLAFNTPTWLHVLNTGQLNYVTDKSIFLTVNNKEELAAALENARKKGKPALLDFYADWCASCVEMEKNIFNQQSIQSQLKNFVLIRADLTSNSVDDQAIMQHYKVIAPPTVLFFAPQGKEQDNLRIIGAVSSQEFKDQVDIFARNNCDKKSVC